MVRAIEEFALELELDQAADVRRQHRVLIRVCLDNPVGRAVQDQLVRNESGSLQKQDTKESTEESSSTE